MTQDHVSYVMVLFLMGLTQKLFLHLIMVIESYFMISDSLSHILLFMAAFSPTDAAIISPYITANSLSTTIS